MFSQPFEQQPGAIAPQHLRRLLHHLELWRKHIAQIEIVEKQERQVAAGFDSQFARTPQNVPRRT